MSMGEKTANCIRYKDSLSSLEKKWRNESKVGTESQFLAKHCVSAGRRRVFSYTPKAFRY